MEQKEKHVVSEKKNEEKDIQHGKEGMDAEGPSPQKKLSNQSSMEMLNLSGGYNPHMYHDEGGESGESV